MYAWLDRSYPCRRAGRLDYGAPPHSRPGGETQGIVFGLGGTPTDAISANSEASFRGRDGAGLAMRGVDMAIGRQIRAAGSFNSGVIAGGGRAVRGDLEARASATGSLGVHGFEALRPAPAGRPAAAGRVLDTAEVCCSAG
jgi:hypothetical protein